MAPRNGSVTSMLQTCCLSILTAMSPHEARDANCSFTASRALSVQYPASDPIAQLAMLQTPAPAAEPPKPAEAAKSLFQVQPHTVLPEARFNELCAHCAGRDCPICLYGGDSLQT